MDNLCVSSFYSSRGVEVDRFSHYIRMGAGSGYFFVIIASAKPGGKSSRIIAEPIYDNSMVEPI
eukprot:CAMPEP_0185767654 /NCGR_PEP_ID=MMETSP1174-20130828/45474_1 /TAXON_ID=35687 /ORGANISM="Dictyocha speculum, Strain CCMP1381" /LENGTH=63 /DNA_ID=CAMNT_0028451975 /DNA_START=677 /DNA_END=868 /DNA_ORIENTATION=-